MNEEENLVRQLRDAAIQAAEHGYYADYLVSVVNVALQDYTRNPDDERRKFDVSNQESKP